MKNKRKLLFQIGTVLVLVVIGAVMMWIGRGHSIYFDNKTLEYNGEKIEAFQRLEVYVKGDRVARLAKKERGVATCVGQEFTFGIEVTVKKGDDPVHHDITLKLPYNLDGIVINVPGYLAGLPQDAWQTEFVPMVVQTDVDEEIVTDEFELGDV